MDETHLSVGLFQKKSKQVGLRLYFSEKPPLKFLDLFFRNSRENKLSPLKILKNCVTSLGNSKVKNQNPWKFHMRFFITCGNTNSFLAEPWNFQMLFLQYPWKFHVLNPLAHVWVFSGIAHC